MDPTIVMENRPGRVVLNRYELMEQIGRGGFSTVFRAYDSKMGREVAVKAVARTEELTGRATREAMAAAKLGHPHIVTVFELAQDDHEVYIVTELVRGRTLGRRLLGGGLSDREFTEILLQVLEALGHAHDQGVIHRDIKPENIMIVEDRGFSRAKVMDFGIAQLENTQRLTRHGDVVGTISYMSPEQANGQPVSGATDVYSAALTLYECLTGANPFRAATAAETIGKIQAGAQPLMQVRPDLPEELSHLVEEAMEPNPQLRLDLRSFAAGLGQVMPELFGGDRATTVMKRANMPRPSVYQEVTERYGFIAARVANGGLAALVALAAVYGSGYYPAGPWRPLLVIATALLVALLPRAGLIGLAGVALLPVASYSVALGVVLAAFIAVYIMTFGLTRPRLALLPVLAVGLGFAGLGLAYPAVSGILGRWRRGLVLALLGGGALTLSQLFSDAQTLDYLGIPNGYGLRANLAGEYNPVMALTALAQPFRQQPVLLLQPAIWLVAALPAALLIRRRSRLMDISGLAAADILLAAGYLELPRVLPGFALEEAAFLKTFALCVIIQFGVLLISPRTKSQSQKVCS